MAKRKATNSVDGDGDGEAVKKPVVRKIPKLLKPKILLLLAESDIALDISAIKVLLEAKYEYPDSNENKNKVWKTLKEIPASDEFGRVGRMYHGGKDSRSFATITPEHIAQAEEDKKKPVEKYTCQECKAFDEYCQISETIPGPYDGSTLTEYKCLNSCYRVFRVLVHGNKRVYSHGYDFEETTEVLID